MRRDENDLLSLWTRADAVLEASPFGKPRYGRK